MRSLTRLVKAVVLSLMIGVFVMAEANAADITDPENTLLLELKDGTVVIEMYPEKAPNHVSRVKELTREGFYDGIVFHRVIDGFMAQTGDPTGTGMGGSGKNIKAEFNDVSHERGVVSMARAMDPHSADSQFFIVFDDSKFLDGQYTAWGKVIDGMEHVDSIKKGDASRNGKVEDPDRIVTLRVAADVSKPEAAPVAEADADTDETSSNATPADAESDEDAANAAAESKENTEKAVEAQ